MARLIEGSLKEGNFTVVKKEGKLGDLIPKHNHPGANILFTVVKGNIEVTINETEVYDLVPGKILEFDGTNYISAKYLAESEVFIVLVKQ